MRSTSVLLLLVGLVSIQLSSTLVLGATPTSQIVIYVETTTEISMPVRIELGAVTLQSASAQITLRPVRRTLDSADLAGTQQLLVDQPLVPGHYDSLHLDFDGITTHVGQAAVSPELPAAGLSIPIDLDIPASECAFLVLRWRPRTPAETGPHVPDLSIQVPEVPPLGSLIFVSNEKSDSMTVVDEATGRVVDCIAVGRQPRGIVYSPTDRLIFVALAGGDAVAVLEAASRRVLQTVALRFGDEPSRLLHVAEQNRLYVLNVASNTIAVFSTPDMRDLGRIAVSPRPRAFVRDDRTGYLYVACESAGEIFVYDPNRANPVASLMVDTMPTELAFDGSSRQLYVASGLRRRIVIVDTETGESKDHIDLCGVAEGLILDPTSRRLYAAAGRCRQIAILAPAASMEIRSIDLEESPGLIALTGDRRRVLATLPTVDRLAICNVTGSSVEAMIETGRGPYAVIAP